MGIETNMFTAERIRLTALRSEDHAVISAWYEDSELIRQWMANPAYPIEKRHITKWLESDDSSNSMKSGYRFAIRLLYSDELIGLVELDDIMWNNRHGWLAIGIGSSAHRNKGYGREAMLLLLRFAFNELNLNRVQLTVFSYNARAIRLYERLGFRREGIMREYILREGEVYDLYHYGLLAREWRELTAAQR